LGIGVKGLGFRLWGPSAAQFAGPLGFTVRGVGFRVWGLGFRVWVKGFRLWCLVFRGEGFGFRI